MRQPVPDSHVWLCAIALIPLTTITLIADLTPLLAAAWLLWSALTVTLLARAR